MIKNISVIPGDGVGPEITQQSIKVLDAVAAHFHHQFNYTYCLIGAVAIEETGNPLPDKTIETCLAADAILFGTVINNGGNIGQSDKANARDGLDRLRKLLGLFANIRPVFTYPSLHHLSPLKSKIIEGVDFIVFMELNGGVYIGGKTINGEETTGNDPSIYLTTEIEKIAHLAFSSARERSKKLTLIDNPNVMETSKLWRKVVREIGLQYPEVSLNFLLADNAARQLMLNPKQFDVILTENLLGDIFNEEASVISGSLGLLPSASIGISCGLFSPVHSEYPLVSGKDIANPLGSILSVAMMLDFFKLEEEAQLVRDAVRWTIESLFVSKDLDPINFYFTSTIGELVSEYIGGRVSGRVNKENIELRKSTII